MPTGWKDSFLLQFSYKTFFFQICPFRKDSRKTYLKVIVSGIFGIVDCTECCKTWFITFDGKPCKPEIKGLFYQGPTQKKPLLQSGILQGHCKINKVGNVNVALNVADCNGGMDNKSLRIPYDLKTSIYIEEIDPPQI